MPHSRIHAAAGHDLKFKLHSPQTCSEPPATMHELSVLQHITLTLTSQLDSQALARALIEVLDHSGWAAGATLLETHYQEGMDAAPAVLLFDVELGIAHRSAPDLRGVALALAAARLAFGAGSSVGVSSKSSS